MNPASQLRNSFASFTKAVKLLTLELSLATEVFHTEACLYIYTLWGGGGGGASALRWENNKHIYYMWQRDSKARELGKIKLSMGNPRVTDPLYETLLQK